MHEISIKAEEIFHIGTFAVTNSIFLGALTALLLLGVGMLIRRGLSPVPGKIQSFFEVFLELALDTMDSVLGSREASLRYLPVIGTVFLFILTSNWLGLLPLSHISLQHAPLFRAPTADLNFTIAMAIISVLAVNIFGVAAIGLRSHLHKFFNFSSPVMFFVGILEFISEFVKIVSFSFRLFGNIFAGEVLLMIVAFIVPYGVPLPFLFLEVFVGLIQALIFSMLTLVFLGMATVSHEEH